MPFDPDRLDAHPLIDWTGPHGLPLFSDVRDEDFGPVIDAALAAHKAEIEAIAGNPAAPTIGNTLAALELSGEALERAAAVFWALAGAHTNDAIQALERAVAPKMARHGSEISMNPALFARIDALYGRRAEMNLDPETLRVLEKTWKRFIRAGAKLDESGKARLAAINENWLAWAPSSARTCWPTNGTGCCSWMRATWPACPTPSVAPWRKQPRAEASQAAGR